MNLNDNPTIEQLRDLIHKGDDFAGHHVVWVTKYGAVLLSRIPKGQKPIWPEHNYPDAQMCSEVYRIGKGYVGPEAATDNEWMTELFNCLVKEWPKAKDTPGVVHLDTISGLEDLKADVEEPAKPRREQEGEKNGRSSLNLNNNPSIEQLRDLIKQGNDFAGHHIMWVKKDGQVMLSRIPKGQKPIWPEQEHPDLQMCTEVYRLGNGYVGPEAAANDAWMTELFNYLAKGWSKAKQEMKVCHLETTLGSED